jgi:hypothetical protein
VIPKMERARSKEIMLRVLNEKLAILDVLRDATEECGEARQILNRFANTM